MNVIIIDRVIEGIVGKGKRFCRTVLEKIELLNRERLSGFMREPRDFCGVFVDAFFCDFEVPR